MKTIGTWYAILATHSGEEILIVKVPKINAANRWIAGRVMTAVRAQMPLQRLGFEVVVVDGETADGPEVYGSSRAAEEYIRHRIPLFASYRWQFLKLRWR